MYSTTDFRKGLKIEIDNAPYLIVDFQHVKPGKGGAFVRTKLKNLLSGGIVDKTFRAGEKVGKPDVNQCGMQFLYSDKEGYHFMNNDTYDQVLVSPDDVGEGKKFLKENTAVEILEYRGKVFGVELPIFVSLEVSSTEPGFKGDTSSGGSKPARLETGYEVNVPLFINEGDILKIDTRTGDYVERVKE